MGADVGHDLDLERMHQAVALAVPREAGLRGAGRGIGHELGLFACLQRAKRRELIGGRAGVIEPGEVQRLMRRRHLLERGCVDLVHLGMAAVFLAGIDLDRLRDTHAAGQNVAHQLEERQIERSFRMQRHRGPKRHGSLGLEVLSQ